MKKRSPVQVRNLAWLIREPSATNLPPGLTGDEWAIPLTQSCLALVDEGDVGWLSAWNWQAQVPETSQQIRAFRIERHGSRRQKIFMHRQLLDAQPEQEVDHRDQHKLWNYGIVDNRRHNLRITTKSQNHANERKREGCSSRYKGVWWNRRLNKWQVAIRSEGKRRHPGLFTSELAAAQAYNDAHTNHFPGISEGLNRLEVA